jgi:DinB family protein
MNELNQNTTNFIEQFKAIQVWADKLKRDLTEEKFNQKPASGGWSVGECLQHINITAEQYMPGIENTISKAKEKKSFSDEKFKARFIQNKLISSLEPPYKRKIKTFKAFEPTIDLNLQATFDTFKKFNDQIINFVKESNGINLNKAVLVSPVSKLVRLKLGEAFLLLATHTRRHLWQAEQVNKR